MQRLCIVGSIQLRTATILENICSFLPGAPFTVFFFHQKKQCSPNRYQFSRKICMFIDQIWFPREPFLCVHLTGTDFQEHFFCGYLPNRYRFSRSTLLATEHIPIFQEHFFLATEQITIFQEHVFSYRTDTDFPGSLFRISTNR